MADSGADLLTQPPIITHDTKRLRLTTWQTPDVDGLRPIIESATVMQWTSQLPVTTREQAEQWFSARAFGPGVLNFMIRQHGSDEIIGTVGSFHRPSCGYLIHPGHFGKGIATEALQGFIEIYFAHVPSKRSEAIGSLSDSDTATLPNPDAYDHLEAWTDTENMASQAVLRKCGFQKVAVHANDFHNPSMGLRSSAVWRLPRPGMSLHDLGLAGPELADGEDDAPPAPPVQ